VFFKGIVCVCIGIHLCGCTTAGALSALNEKYPVHDPLSLSNVYRQADFASIKIHDVAVVIFTNESGVKKEIEASATDKVIAELQKRGWYVIHKFTAEDAANPEMLMKVDAVMTGEILEYRENEPLRFGVKLVLKDLATDETLWSAQEVFDSSKQTVVNSIKYYYQKNIEKKYPMMAYKLYLVSMDKFLDYCFYKLINSMR
jgi:hypothetical protein